MGENKNNSVTRNESAVVTNQQGSDNRGEENKDKATSPTPVNFVNIPAELKKNASFCVWKRELRGGNITKVPYNAETGKPAKSNDASTFSDFTTAMKAYAMGGVNGNSAYAGIGFRVSEGIGAIDIDHCIREDGTLNDVAATVLSMFNTSYFERSPSGTGLRGFFKLSPDFTYDKTVYYINNRQHGLEVYLPGTTNRFVTVTGDVYKPGEVVRNDAALTAVLDAFMKRKTPTTNRVIEPCSYLSDDQVLKHAASSESGAKFQLLYSGDWEELYASQSDADMALVAMLAFWCGNVEEQIDRIFRDSGLYRPKWDRMTGDSTYGAITIRNAVASNTAIYMPVQKCDPQMEFDDLDEEEEQPDFAPDISHIKLTLDEMQPHINARYGRDEIGIGNAFADYFKPIARFNRSRGIWYVYDGKVWQPDEGGLAVAELAKLLADRLYTFALNIKDEDARNRYIKRVLKLQQRKNRKTMLEDAKSVHPISFSAFDRNKYLFNCENGTLDLDTMEFRAHDPRDFITKMSHVTYDRDAVSPRWIQFIEEVMEGNRNVARYLQKCFGYSMTGDNSQHYLFIMNGPKTRNGKTTTVDTILKVMGEYGRSAKPDMLATNFFKGPSNGAPSEDVARLAGARFVGIAEMEEKLVLNASLTKLLTGGNIITARFLHENSFEFEMQAKIFIDTNHLPYITDQTLFESGRIKIIPFNRHFKPKERDLRLGAKLSTAESLSGILNWCIEGYKLYKTEGLVEPPEVIAATEKYRLDSDRMGQFFAQCLKKEKGSELKPSAIYTRYREWCGENGYKYESSGNFYKRLGISFQVVRRRPWSQATTGALNTTTLVDDVAWVTGEEPDESLAEGD